MPGFKSSHKTVSSTREFPPESSYTSLYQTIFHLDLFMIQGRFLTSSLLNVQGYGVAEAYLKLLVSGNDMSFKPIISSQQKLSNSRRSLLLFWALTGSPLHMNFFFNLLPGHWADSVTPVLMQLPLVIILGCYCLGCQSFCPTARQDASCKLENSAGLSHTHTHAHKALNTIRCTHSHTLINMDMPE